MWIYLRGQVELFQGKKKKRKKDDVIWREKKKVSDSVWSENEVKLGQTRWTLTQLPTHSKHLLYVFITFTSSYTASGSFPSFFSVIYAVRSGCETLHCSSSFILICVFRFLEVAASNMCLYILSYLNNTASFVLLPSLINFSAMLLLGCSA